MEMGLMCLSCGYKSKVEKEHECKLTRGGKISIKKTLTKNNYYLIHPKRKKNGKQI